ncbi:TPA: DNA polymerase III subunit theta [Klebsiella aerogenes]|nr:DNA polymerase III subunit theta [Klebsiella aerogenes]
MSKHNIAAKSSEEQGKVSVDLAASGVAYKERLNIPVIPEVVMREQPEHLRDYFLERLSHYREESLKLPKASDPRYIEMTDANTKKGT